MAHRILIFGGTFDPIHNGHIAIATQAAKALGAELMLLPSGDPPYRRCHAPQEDRLAMVRLAFPDAEVCTEELFRDTPSYTVDTLTRLRETQPDAEWCYLIGADKLQSLPNWRGFDMLKTLCAFAVVRRPGCSETPIEINGARLIPLDMEGPDISASAVRGRIAEGLPADDMLPNTVRSYIEDKALYLCDDPPLAILERLKGKLKPSRVTHTLGVAETAKRLAPRYGVSTARAYIAGLLHDCAKYMPFEEMQALVRANISDADADELNNEPVLHAPAGCVLAQKEYGVRDPAILNAIRRHTIGDAHMSDLDMLIYVSDFIEPNRKPFEGLEDARAAAERSLCEAVICCTRLTEAFVRQRGGTLHPRTQRMIQTLQNREETHYV